MDIKQMEAFVNVIKHKSFTKAAQLMYLTQPTVSAHIAQLERELATQLIVRTTKEVYPTKVGQVFYSHALQILAQRDKAVEAVRGFEAQMDGEISIGASSVPSNYFLPRLLSEFSIKHPRVSFNIQTGDSKTVVEQVLAQKLEIGLVGTVLSSKKCIFEPFANDKLVIVTPNLPQYRDIVEKKYYINRLLQEPFISREAGSGTRKEAEYLIREMGFDPSKLNIVAEMQDNESIIRSVSQGLGISVISNCAAEEYRQYGKVLTYGLQQSQRSRMLYLVRHKISPLSPVAHSFYEFAQKFYNTKG